MSTPIATNEKTGNKGELMRYEAFPLLIEHGQMNIPDEVLTGIWNQMVVENKAQKVFYDGLVTSVFKFINFLKQVQLPILIWDNKTKSLCHIAWISDYAHGHGCLHHCSLGQFKRGSIKAILKYYELFKDNTGEPAFETLVGIIPENNEPSVRLAKLMGFTLLSPSLPSLCNDVYSGKRIGAVLSYFQYQR